MPVVVLSATLLVVILLVAGGSGWSSAAAAPARGATGEPHAMIVHGVPGSAAVVEEAVRQQGGSVTRALPIIDGVAARLTPAAAAALQRRGDVVAVTPDASGRVLSANPPAGLLDPILDPAETGALEAITRIVRAQEVWSGGYTGKGVDVAVIDTGVAPVQGLTSGNVVNGPDLSFESQRKDVRYRDTYGHGTHVSSIIAGRDAVGTPATYRDPTKFVGVAPDARIVNLKVASADGSADVSQVIAAINWVTENANKNGLNIRVLNLSYGTDSKQDWRADPLAYAVDVAWRKGIVVVAAGGNDGTSNQDLANPARNPNVIAVGAEDPVGTIPVADDRVPAFSDRGTALRHVDVVAPGTHVLGLRVPNGYIDQLHPTARAGTRFFRGSGTSQAAAVVSGTAALLLQINPQLTPNAIKTILVQTARPFLLGTVTNTGAGVIDAGAAGLFAGLDGVASELGGDIDYTQASVAAAAGSGSLETSRGSSHVRTNGVELTGERDIFAVAWPGAQWAARAEQGTTWSGGRWNSTVWTGSGWETPTDWAAANWKASAWDGTPWSSRPWTPRIWTNGGWDSRTWVNESWSSRTWVDHSWANGGWQ